MTSAQFEALNALFTSGHKPEIWGSDKAGWRIGPLYRVPVQLKRSLEHHGWIKNARARIDSDRVMTEWFEVTDEGRRAFIAAGGNPGEHGRSKRSRRRR